MENLVDTCVRRFLSERRRRRRIAGIRLVLSVSVALGVFWQLHRTGVALVNESCCGYEEHQHDDACYEDCDLPEHVHSITCMLDETAEVETEAEADAVTVFSEECHDAAEPYTVRADDAAICPLMEGVGENPFPTDTMNRFAVTWTNALGGEVYTWSNGGGDNSDQSTIDALSSGDYQVKIDFREAGYPINLLNHVTYTLQLDWPVGDDVTVSIKGGNSGTVGRTDGGVLFSWEVSDTGLLSVTIGERYDSFTGELDFTASVVREEEDLPVGSTTQAEPSIQKDGVIDEAVYDVVTWTVTAVLPRRLENQNGGRAYVWSCEDEIKLSTYRYGSIVNDLSKTQVVLSSEEYPGGIEVPSVDEAGDVPFAFCLDAQDDSWTDLYFFNRCTCGEDNCANWSGGCGNEYEDTGFCTCWLSAFNASVTLTYATDISDVMQKEEDANYSKAVNITNNVYLNKNGSEVSYDDDTEFIYAPFVKRETVKADDNDGAAAYEIVFNSQGVDYSWAESITVTDRMDHLALGAGSMTVRSGDTVLTQIGEEEAAGLDPQNDRDQYYSLSVKEDADGEGDKTGENLTVTVWYPTNRTGTLEYEALVLCYAQSKTGSYSNTAEIGRVVQEVKGDYTEGGSNSQGTGYDDSMTLTKVDADDPDAALSGAVFQIYKYEENREDRLMAERTTGEDGTFTFQSDAEHGIIMEEDVLYYMIEIKPPAGYCLSDTRYGFVFEENGYTGAYPDGLDPEHVIFGEPDGSGICAAMTVENKKGAELPKTGGPGTIPYTLTGLLLLCTALCLLCLRKRPGQ